MKRIYRNIIAAITCVALAAGVSACQEADPEFEHPNNLISVMYLQIVQASGGVPGVIYEYNAQGELVPTEQVTLETVKGGYGKIVFELDPSLKDTYDLEHCYLNTSLTFDEIVTPGLGGQHNIVNRDENGVARGINITVTSGTGDVRPYNIIGYFEGEEVLPPVE